MKSSGRLALPYEPHPLQTRNLTSGPQNTVVDLASPTRCRLMPEDHANHPGLSQQERPASKHLREDGDRQRQAYVGGSVHNVRRPPTLNGWPITSAFTLSDERCVKVCDDTHRAELSSRSECSLNFRIRGKAARCLPACIVMSCSFPVCEPNMSE